MNRVVLSSSPRIGIQHNLEPGRVETKWYGGMAAQDTARASTGKSPSQNPAVRFLSAALLEEIYWQRRSAIYLIHPSVWSSSRPQNLHIARWRSHILARIRSLVWPEISAPESLSIRKFSPTTKIREIVSYPSSIHVQFSKITARASMSRPLFIDHGVNP
jgi:hypothetical protein